MEKKDLIKLLIKKIESSDAIDGVIEYIDSLRIDNMPLTYEQKIRLLNDVKEEKSKNFPFIFESNEEFLKLVSKMEEHIKKNKNGGKK